VPNRQEADAEAQVNEEEEEEEEDEDANTRRRELPLPPNATNVKNQEEEETSVAARRRNCERRINVPSEEDDVSVSALQFDAKELNALTSSSGNARMACPAMEADEDIEMTPRKRAFKSTAV
jgi:hypothetical protein